MRRSSTRYARVLVYAALTLGWATQRARAGGLDAPVLPAARPAGMGGAAVADVSDASAVVHNPAGIAAVRGLALLGGAAVLVTNLQTSPDYADQNISSGSKLAAVPFLAGALSIDEGIALGIAVYPVGAVGGEFHYRNAVDVPTVNRMQALLIEASPALGVALPYGLRLGVGYRINVLSFQRTLGPEADPDKVDVDLLGANFLGFRAGAQWLATEGVQFGLAYRHRIEVAASAQRGTLFGQTLRDLETALVLPSKLVVGTRIDRGSIGLACDLEYIFNEQLQAITIRGELPAQGSHLSTPFLFRWKNTLTLKLGTELALAEHWKLRLGYALDGTPNNPRYPSAFSGPPATAHYGTLGGELRAGDYRFNLALVHRYVPAVQLDESEIADSDECLFCAKQGQYWNAATGVVFDVAADFAW